MQHKAKRRRTKNERNEKYIKRTFSHYQEASVLNFVALRMDRRRGSGWEWMSSLSPSLALSLLLSRHLTGLSFRQSVRAMDMASWWSVNGTGGSSDFSQASKSWAIKSADNFYICHKLCDTRKSIFCILFVYLKTRATTTTTTVKQAQWQSASGRLIDVTIP